MKRTLACTALLLAAPAAWGTNYTEVIPAMGPAALPGPAVLGEPPTIVRAQIIDATGAVDFVFKEYGQNWECTGQNGNPNDPDNYPVVALFDIGPLPQGFTDGTALDLAGATELARLAIPFARDAQECLIENNCHALHTYLKPIGAAGSAAVQAGDVLVWAVLRHGNNCPGQWWVNHHGNPPFPGAPGGEITLGIHVRD